MVLVVLNDRVNGGQGAGIVSLSIQIGQSPDGNGIVRNRQTQNDGVNQRPQTADFAGALVSIPRGRFCRPPEAANSLQFSVCKELIWPHLHSVSPVCLTLSRNNAGLPQLC